MDEQARYWQRTCKEVDDRDIGSCDAVRFAMAPLYRRRPVSARNNQGCGNPSSYAPSPGGVSNRGFGLAGSMPARAAIRAARPPGESGEKASLALPMEFRRLADDGMVTEER